MLNLAIGRLLPTLHPPRTDLRGKTALITGANSGIGLQIAHDLLLQNATVYLACRNPAKAYAAAADLTSRIPNCADRVQCLELDTSSLASVRALTESWSTPKSETTTSTPPKKIDLLFHNAGIGTAPKDTPYTEDGFPIVYATNFLGSFLLTHLLEPHLSSSARVIMTSSTGQYGAKFSPTLPLARSKHQVEAGFHIPATPHSSSSSPKTSSSKAPSPAFDKEPPPAQDSAAYAQTKAMQVAFAQLLQAHFDRQSHSPSTSTSSPKNKERKTAHAFTPGMTSTPIFEKVSAPRPASDPLFWILRWTSGLLATDVAQGAATGVWLASTDDERVVGKGKGGGYWDRMTRRTTPVDLMARERLERFWIRWEKDAGAEW